MVKHVLGFAVFLVATPFLWADTAHSTTPVKVSLEPSVVSIGALFNGAQITVSGEVPSASEVMIMVRGRNEDLQVRRKGRVLGFLWMNTGNMTFHQVPSLYLLYTSKALDTLAQTHPEWWQRLPYGFESLKKETMITPPCGEESEGLFREFLKLKRQEGLYVLHRGEIGYAREQGQERSYEAAVWIPPKVPPGQYEVRVVAFNGGSPVGTSSEYLKVREVGIPARLSSFSMNHGILYGILAVLIAIGAGLLMDMLFGTRRPH